MLALNKLGLMIFKGKPLQKFIAGTLLLTKMAAIVLILYLLSTISLDHLIWTAGGILLGLIAISVFILKKRSNREDSSDG